MNPETNPSDDQLKDESARRRAEGETQKLGADRLNRQGNIAGRSDDQELPAP